MKLRETAHVDCERFSRFLSGGVNPWGNLSKVWIEAGFWSHPPRPELQEARIAVLAKMDLLSPARVRDTSDESSCALYTRDRARLLSTGGRGLHWGETRLLKEESEKSKEGPG
jgi:hypothetical protein